MVHMVQAWCGRNVLGFQTGDTVCTIDTIGSAVLIEIGRDRVSGFFARVHENDGAHGAHGVTRLILQRKTTAPWVHHRHHRTFLQHHRNTQPAYLPSESPPA